MPGLHTIRPPVAAAEQREAAFEDEVLANPAYAVWLKDHGLRFYDCFAAERSLAGSAAATGDLRGDDSSVE